MKKCIKKSMVIKIKLMKRIRVILICIVMVMTFQSIFAQRIDWSQPHYTTEQELNGLRQLIMKGDTVAFFKYVFYGKNSPESLPYALFMANNYHSLYAYYFVYELTLMLYEDYHLMIDSTSYSFAFQYLLKGAELGCSNCDNKLAIIYYMGNRFVPQDTVKAKEFYTKEYNDDDTKEREWISFKRVYQRAFDAREERY